MRPADKIEKAIQQANCEATDATRRRLWQDVAGSLHPSQTAKQPHRGVSLWRIIMDSRITKPAIVAVIAIAALAVGVERLAHTKADKTYAFSAEIRTNMALDLDPKAAIPLRQAQPGDFDVTWDAEDGGTLRIMPGSSLRLLANTWHDAEWEDILWWARSDLAKVRESAATSISARDARFVAILTSEGNLAVVEIGAHDESRARLKWQVESAALPVYGPVQVVTLTRVDRDEATPQPSAIDFDTGRTISIPPQVLGLAPERFLDWLEQNGIDAIARMSDDGAGLVGVGLTFAGNPPGAWAGQSAAELRDDMLRASYQPRDPILFRAGQYQLAHPFKTREGGLGMLQLCGVDRDKRTVQFRYRMLQEATGGEAAATTQEDAESLQLARSQEWLMRLGRSILIYANDNEDRLPASIEEIRKYADSEEHYRWIVENVEYVGAGYSTSEPPMLVVAYDKTLLAAGKGTYVLFLDSHTEFVAPGRLAEYGLADGIESVTRKNAGMAERGRSDRQLSGLGRALLIYGSQNEDRLPPSLEEIKTQLDNEERYQWLAKNVQYVGAGLLFSQSPALVVAYDKTLPAAGEGTNVLFLDTHVEFIEPERLAEYGLPPGPRK